MPLKPIFRFFCSGVDVDYNSYFILDFSLLRDPAQQRRSGCFRHLRQLLHQLERHLPEVKRALELIDHADPEMSGHFSVCERPVVDPAGREPLVPDERFETVSRNVGIDTAGDQHGAGKFLCSPLPDALQFGIEKAPVEARVVGNQMVPGHERGELLHHLGDGRGAAQHPVGDAGIPLDEAADSHTRIHQALEAIDDPVVPDQHRTDLYGPVAAIGREAGGFKVENDHTVITHGMYRQL